MRSTPTLDPKPEYVDSLPFALQAHAFTFWVFLAVFPFTRLVHILTLPIGYLTRPWQRVVRMSDEPAVYHDAADKPLERQH